MTDGFALRTLFAMRKTLEMILGLSAGDVTRERDGITIVESTNRFRV